MNRWPKKGDGKILKYLVLGIVAFVFFSFVIHSRNWTWENESTVKIASGFYFETIPFNQIHGIEKVKKIGSLSKSGGFSALDMKKGSFIRKTDGKKIKLFLEDARKEMVYLTYGEDQELFINFSKSKTTDAFYENLKIQQQKFNK